MFFCVGKQLRSCVGGLVFREVATPHLDRYSTYGVVDGGLNLMCQAVSSLKCLWMVDRPAEPRALNNVTKLRVKGLPQFTAELLAQQPVDMLFMEHYDRTNVNYCFETAWDSAVFQTSPTAQPAVVIEAWTSRASLWQYGPVCKVAVTRWSEAGYETRCRDVSATEVGGAVSQQRLMVIRLKAGTEWNWAPLEQMEHPRPMSNLLDPPGLIRRGSYLDHIYSSAISAELEPMPPQSGRLIKTEKGIRRLLSHELAKGLGCTESSSHFPVPMIERSTSMFHWHYVLESLWATSSAALRPTPPALEHAPQDGVCPPIQTEDSQFRWAPPDLSSEGTWYAARVQTLSTACQHYPDSENMFQEGLRMLEIHRQNYDAEGPNAQQLQLLWWEFPPEHWDSLRNGCSMNFLHEPEPIIHPNSPMDDEQRAVAVEFVEELISLNILTRPPPGMTVKATTPLFCVPKEGQPGQWRVIADMLRGGQNKAVGADPVFLPRTFHLLDSLYEGGFSAVVDASKFYHLFPTDPDDQPFLGVVHPSTGELWIWSGLPMGAGNSPALGNKFGIAFLRKLCERHDIFGVTGEANCYWTSFTAAGEFHPERGHGFILRGPNDLAVLIWAYVDDFLIHAPTKALCEQALTFFMDAALECGMLCHPKKLVLPSQEVKYCGVLINTAGIPTLKMPVQKRERSLAMLRHVTSRPTKKWSRLALSVLAGVLESLSECTPRRMGHTYLRGLHQLIHQDRTGTGLEPYLSCTVLPSRVLLDLQWWDLHLRQGKGRAVRSKRASILVPTFGDGSGTGTGGTFHLPFHEIQMWKGTWSPEVYHFTSNHKELATLRLTLEHVLHLSPTSVEGVTMFYFTDNSCTYWICNNGSSKQDVLHQELLAIRSLESQLGCHLSVVHVPGKVIITEGTDGLSRGVWLSPLHEQLPRDVLLTSIFSPIMSDPALVHHYVSCHVLEYHRSHCLPIGSWLREWFIAPWDELWCTLPVMDQFSVWFPPPELARQVLSYVLYRYVESPLTTAALFFVPRVLPAFWHNLSKYVVELPTFFPHLSDLPSFSSVLPIPVVVLYLPPHQRRLPTKDRLDISPSPYRARWHRQQAEELRRVSPVSGAVS